MLCDVLHASSTRFAPPFSRSSLSWVTRMSRSSIRARSTRSTCPTRARSGTSRRAASQTAKREKRVVARAASARGPTRGVLSILRSRSAPSASLWKRRIDHDGTVQVWRRRPLNRLERQPPSRTPDRVSRCIAEVVLAQRPHAPVRSLEGFVDGFAEELADERGKRQALDGKAVKRQAAREPHRARKVLHAAAPEEPPLVGGVVRPLSNLSVRHDAGDEVARQHLSIAVTRTSNTVTSRPAQTWRRATRAEDVHQSAVSTSMKSSGSCSYSWMPGKESFAVAHHGDWDVAKVGCDSARLHFIEELALPESYDVAPTGE